VHCLVRLHSPVSVATLAHDIKGASSHLITHLIAPGQGFKWQGNYGAFSVSPGELDPVRAYIRNQKQHHAGSTTRSEWERTTDFNRR
jgi:REP element-mobilizing transposase RayT